MPRLAVFDLDGTLVDSLPDLLAALDRLVMPRGARPFTSAEVRPMIGDGLHALLSRALAARALALDDATLASFTADYTAHAAELSRPFPGIIEALADLAAAGWRCAVCTNKPEAAAAGLLGALGLAGHFVTVGAGDSFAARKPDPRHLLGTIAAAGAAPAEAVMLGDHANDIHAAQAAGVQAVFAGWGYGMPAMAEGAAAIAAQPGDIVGVLLGLG